MVVMFLEKLAPECVLEEVIVKDVLKHRVEIKVGVVMEAAGPARFEEGVEIERCGTLLTGALCTERVVLFSLVLVGENVVRCVRV